jgi:hypothetical protein
MRDTYCWGVDREFARTRGVRDVEEDPHAALQVVRAGFPEPEKLKGVERSAWPLISEKVAVSTL